MWPVPPDWGNGVTETLAFSTDVMQASATASSQHRGTLIAPRRSLGFEIVAYGPERRVADMLLAGHGGEWLLPIFPDVQWVGGSVEATDEFISCKTAGFDFAVGAKALLWRGLNTWEVIEVAEIDETGLVLAAPLVNDWAGLGIAPGARLYPLRRANLQDGVEEELLSDMAGKRSLTFDVLDACDWPVLDAPTLYLGHPVLTVRPDESENPTASYSRLLQSVDYGTAAPLVHDLPKLALRTQQHRWVLHRRPAHSWFRSLLYTLDGRRVPMWVPSWNSDLKMADAIGAASVYLQVEWVGYTLFGLNQPNRRDIRIELSDGSVFYRRIAASIEAGDVETLTLDSALGVAVAPGAVRCVSFMALCTLASDSIEIEHATDAAGVATSTTGWTAVVPDV
ncbi:MAG: hypothetical protein DI597_00755 [Pseudoxanthomonas spadix]|nr:MAG: hypothetical protein DI597_00755 [Pseudoxanthomonas spadix]